LKVAAGKGHMRGKRERLPERNWGAHENVVFFPFCCLREQKNVFFSPRVFPSRVAFFLASILILCAGYHTRPPGHQAPVVQKVDDAIRWINLYPVDNAIGFPNTYPLDPSAVSLRSRRLEVVGERENGRARGRHARGEGASPLACLLLAHPFFLVPTTTTSKRLLRKLSAVRAIQVFEQPGPWPAD